MVLERARYSKTEGHSRHAKASLSLLIVGAAFGGALGGLSTTLVSYTGATW